MPTYGPWTQDPDYVLDYYVTDSLRNSRCIELGLNRFPRAYAYGYVDTEGGPAQFTDGSIIDLFALVEDGVEDPPWEAAPRATEVGRRSTVIAFDPTVYRNRGWVAIGHCPVPVTLHPNSGQWYPETPDGVAGVEWQDHPEWDFGYSQRVGLALKAGSELRETGYLHTAAGHSVSTKVMWADMSRAQDETYMGEATEGDSGDVTELTSFSRPSVSSDAVYTLGYDIDLTGVADPDVGGVLYTINPDFVPTTNNEYYDEDWQYGSSFLRPLIAETFRPPVYRLVYADLPQITGEEAGTRRRFN